MFNKMFPSFTSSSSAYHFDRCGDTSIGRGGFGRLHVLKRSMRENNRDIRTWTSMNIMSKLFFLFVLHATGFINCARIRSARSVQVALSSALKGRAANIHALV